MRKLIPLIVAAALLAGCGEHQKQVSPTEMLITDHDGDVDARQEIEACKTLGLVVKNEVQSNDGDAAVVICGRLQKTP